VFIRDAEEGAHTRQMTTDSSAELQDKNSDVQATTSVTAELKHVSYYISNRRTETCDLHQ